MKLRAHISSAMAAYTVIDIYSFSHALTGWPGSSWFAPIALRAYMFMLAPAYNYIVDGLGHTYKQYRGKLFPARNRLHSLPVMLALAFMFLSPMIYIAVVFSLGDKVLYPIIAYAVLLATIHYVEDMVTEKGVYIAGRRVRLPVRIRYDDPVLNYGAEAVSAVTVIAAVLYSVLYMHVVPDMVSLAFATATVAYVL